MIELRNRQYMTVIDCVAGEAMEVGMVLKLEWHAGRDLITAMKATAGADVSQATGPLFAYWINERSTAVTFLTNGDGTDLSILASTDLDSIHYIPSGARMLAVGGPGVAEIRFFPESLDPAIASDLPDPATELEFATDTAQLCLASDGNASNRVVALVIENDGASVSVIVG